MIPTILFFLLKRYKRRHPAKAERILAIVSKAGKTTGLVILCIAISMFASSQEKKLEYQVKRNGNVVGNVYFTQISSGARTTMKLQSEVRTRFIFLFTAKGLEEAIYDNGIMTWSSIYRKLNGSVKADKKTKAIGNSYTVFKGSKTETLDNYPIRYNMLSIYSTEPLSVSKVYSDNFQQLLDIQKMGDHHYKIKFPDGNYSEYFYQNGICSKVELHHTLYSASIELKM